MTLRSDSINDIQPHWTSMNILRLNNKGIDEYYLIFILLYSQFSGVLPKSPAMQMVCDYNI